MSERELPYECDVCGEEEDRMGIDHATVIVGVCVECSAVCCGSCLPAGAGTKCASCVETNEEDEDAARVSEEGS